MLYFIKKGVDLNHPHLTRDWRIWLEYLCWCIQAKMKSNLYWPVWVRYWWYKRFGQPIYHPPIVNKMWRVVKFWLRARTGERSHRCEFTDPKRGALYGGTDAGFMNEYFEKFIENISGEL